jgi:hypothetical protein
MSIYDTLKEELKNYDLGIFSKEEQERRISICQSCTNYSGDEDHQCSICKCNINWKVMLMQNSCPAGKWTPNN